MSEKHSFSTYLKTSTLFTLVMDGIAYTSSLKGTIFIRKIKLAITKFSEKVYLRLSQINIKKIVISTTEFLIKFYENLIQTLTIKKITMILSIFSTSTRLVETIVVKQIRFIGIVLRTREPFSMQITRVKKVLMNASFLSAEFKLLSDYDANYLSDLDSTNLSDLDYIVV
jgi:hypothetical protein